jgi:predicted anti-sigma-YlaC factor YlaD
MSLKPTCKEVHRLTSEGMDRDLSMVERARVQMHLLVCNACRTFTDQMQLIQHAMRKLAPSEENSREADAP